MDNPTQESPKNSKGCHVNKKLLPIKLFYFALVAAVGSLLPFISIYMKQLGLTPDETGILYGAMPFISFFIRPIIGLIADRWHKHKLMLMLCCVLAGGLFLLILVIPARVQPSFSLRTQLNCNVNDSYFRDCVSTSVVNCSYGLSDFADAVFNLTENNNQTDFNCQVQCSEISDSSSQDVEVCFTDSLEPFLHHCNGTLIRHRSFQFSLLNISHVLKNEVISDRRTISTVQCRDYDLKSVQHKEQTFWQLLCDEEGTFDCHMTCNNLPSQLCPAHDEEFDCTFGWLFFIFLLGNLNFAPLTSLGDAAAYDLLEDEKFRFGEQRMWGTVGYALFAIASTFIMYMRSLQGAAIDYTASFCIFAVMCVLSAVAVFFTNLSNQIKCNNMSGNFLSLLKVPKIFAFLVVVLYFGMSAGAIEGFLFWYLTDIGATTLVFGFSIITNCAFEVPMFMVSGTILKKVGPMCCLYMALAALVVRHLGYSLLLEPWGVLAIEPLHGVTFGLMWAAATNYAATIAPPGMSATIQGLVGGLYFGIGRGLGGVLTGFLFVRVGERWTFRIYAIASACLLLLYALLNWFVFKTHARSSHSPSQVVKSDSTSTIIDQ